MADGAGPTALPGSVDETIAALRSAGYIADRGLATAVYLSLVRRRPLFLEGDAGVGKTEVAKVLAKVLGRDLIRLQCYEGLDIASALYEWNYSRQMLELRLSEAAGEHDREALEQSIFSEKFLLRRPLLDALTPRPSGPPVLLIDELDRADEPFEAFLLEILSDFTVTVPELGTVHADEPPIVVITSNRTREVHDALRRRCFYCWLDYPSAERERQILALKAPEASEALRRQVVAVVQALRARDLFKIPGIAESIDWVQALVALDRVELEPESLNDTLGVVLKYQDDLRRLQGDAGPQLLAEALDAG